MEQEPERELLSYTVKRIGYKLRLAGHFVFLFIAFVLAVSALVALVVTKFYLAG